MMKSIIKMIGVASIKMAFHMKPARRLQIDKNLCRLLMAHATESGRLLRSKQRRF
ncbi:MAG: hypothetical protein HF978_10770 [Desulfobacteraceae bacterium]|nr:hypothetical protein [Desulfobacteraceae bacterium]MBC2756018.1 hypothetical protein [Desulfobacteraceae bacterium]